MALTLAVRRDLCKIANQHAVILTSGKVTKGQPEVSADTKCNILHEFTTLFEKLVNTIPENSEAKTNQSLLKNAVAALDVASKHGITLDVLNPLAPWTEDRMLRLRDALQSTAGEVLPAEIIAAIMKMWGILYMDIVDKFAHLFLVDATGFKYQSLEILANAMTGHDKEKHVLIAEWLHAAWRMASSSRAMVEKSPNATENEKDQALKEALRGVQRVQHLSVAASKLDKAKDFDLVDKLKNEVELTVEIVTNAGTLMRGKIIESMETKVKSVEEAMTDAGFLKFQERLANNSTDVDELKTFFTQHYAQTDVSSWLALALEVEVFCKSITNKTNEYNLQPAKDCLKRGTECFVAARAAACVWAIMTAVTTIKIVSHADKVTLRTKMKAVQTDLKQFSIKPTELGSQSVLDLYKGALAMQLE